MCRTSRDVAAVWAGQPALDGWDQAGAQAREAMVHHASALHRDTTGGRQPGVAAGGTATRLDAAAAVARLPPRPAPYPTRLPGHPAGPLRRAGPARAGGLRVGQCGWTVGCWRRRYCADPHYDAA